MCIRDSVNSDRFFSERSATRLTINQVEKTLRFNEGRNLNRIGLRQIFVPNTIEDGVNEDARLDSRARIIFGSIDNFGEVDSYRFYAREDQLFFNMELLPVFALGQTFEEGIIGQLRVYQVNRDGTEVLIGENIQSFESLFDTEIFDLVLPTKGYYRVEISAPDEIFFNGGANPPVSLSGAGGADLLTGEYQALMFTSNIRMGAYNRSEHAGTNRGDQRNRNRQGQEEAPDDGY